jgi:hypothetical protein
LEEQIKKAVLGVGWIPLILENLCQATDNAMLFFQGLNQNQSSIGAGLFAIIGNGDFFALKSLKF